MLELGEHMLCICVVLIMRWLLAQRAGGDRKQQITEDTCSSHKPPLKYYLQLEFNILRLHSYKVPLVKGQICTVQYLGMVREKSL